MQRELASAPASGGLSRPLTVCQSVLKLTELEDAVMLAGCLWIKIVSQ
jgi:hypothetical protein